MLTLTWVLQEVLLGFEYGSNCLLLCLNNWFVKSLQLSSIIYIRQTNDFKIKWILQDDETISAQCCISYRNYSFDLQDKSNGWFVCEMQHLTEMG